MVSGRGYYDEDGYWHREPAPRRERRPATPRQYKPIRDPYYDEYRDNYEGYDPYGRRVVVRRVMVGPRRGGRRITTSQLGMFSDAEKRDLVVATLSLALAFTFVMAGGIYFLYNPLGYMIYYFPVALAATVTAFTAHEVAHKFMAQKHGLPAEFVLNPTGIMFALITGLIIGFLFALPGAVVFSGAGVDRKTVGKVGAAGPATNIAMAAGLFPFMLAFMYVLPELWIVVFVNVFLAGFNMLPFGMFDGKKIWDWSPGVYILMLAGVVALGLLSFPATSPLFPPA